MTDDATPEKASTGIAGLDDVLNGGFSRDRLFLVEGKPGTGKTTLALQFLLDGARAGETGLYITLGETEEELRASAASHGWSLDPLNLFELAPPESLLDSEQQQSLLYSSDLELGETTRLIFDKIKRTSPHRVVFDSLSEIRLLAQGSLRYRRQILALKHYFARNKATVLMLDDLTTEEHDTNLHSIAHGVLRLEELAPEYGAERRRLRVSKYRGTRYRGGYHDCEIVTGGLAVFPRLVAIEHGRKFERIAVKSGLEGFDELLGGGIERGSSTLLIGPSGTGKSLLAMHYAVSAIKAGDKATVFLFDEEIGLLLSRAKGMGLALADYIESGHLQLQSINPAELSPGALVHRIRDEVERRGVSTVVIDSLNGYQLAMPEEQYLLLHMHEILTYLNRRGVATLLTIAQHGLVGDMKSPIDVTYLSDAIVLLRYFEAHGRVRRAISAIKKRVGSHEHTIREFQITSEGLRIGKPLSEFQGVLRGVPIYAGGTEPLLRSGPIG